MRGWAGARAAVRCRFPSTLRSGGPGLGPELHTAEDFRLKKPTYQTKKKKERKTIKQINLIEQADGRWPCHFKVLWTVPLSRRRGGSQNHTTSAAAAAPFASKNNTSFLCNTIDFYFHIIQDLWFWKIATATITITTTIKFQNFYISITIT